MKKYLIILLVCASQLSYAQYTGGSNDGFHQSLLSQTTITDNNAFRGGIDDGFALNLLNKTTITDDISSRGGSDDGFHYSLLLKTTITDNAAFRGGNDDGFVSTLLANNSITDNIAFTGGANDGFSLSNLSKVNLTDAIAFLGGNDDGFGYVILPRGNINDPAAYRGGAGRGEIQSLINNNGCGLYVIWNGAVNSAWENSANWNCGIVPGISSDVIIPSGMPVYPVVSLSTEIKSLFLQPAASVTVQPAVLFKLNGQ